MGATAAADAAATVVVAKAKAKAWKLRFWGLACVLLTLSAHYFVLLPLLAAHPTFFIVLSVVPYVRMHPRKQRSTTHLAARANSPPPTSEGTRHLSAPSHTSRNCLRAGLLVLLAHRPQANHRPEAGRGSVQRLLHLLAVDVR